MKALLIIGCVVCCCQILHAQDSVLKKNYILKANIWESNRPVREFYLVNVTDTALLLAAEAVTFRQSLLNPTMLSYRQVNVVTLQRKGSIGRGLWKGALGGMVLGGIIGAITYKDCDDCFIDFGIGADIAAGAILGTGGGAVIGVIVGALARKKFTINGNKEKFDEMKLSVLDMAYRKTN
jgi:hypothetical protein